MDSTLQIELPKLPSTSLQEPLENGLTETSSNLLEHPKEQGCMMSTNTSTVSTNPTKKAKNSCQSATVECQVMDKRKTSKGKSPKCKKNSLTIKSSQTSVQESTLRDKVFEPFWNSRSQDNSRKLWCPTETDFVGLPSNCLNGSFCNMESNSWFLTQMWIPLPTPNLQKISLPSSTFSIAESMEKGSTKPRQRIKTGKAKKETTLTPNSVRKIKLKPNPETRNKLKQWFGSVRVTYNMALDALKKKKYPLNMPALRNRFVNACNIPKEKRYLLDTPKHVREGGLTDLVIAVKQNLQNGGTFDMKYRSRKETQSIVIPKVAIKLLKQEGTLKMYPTFLQTALRINIKQVDNINNDCRLVMDKLGRFYLHVPTYCDYAFENQEGKKQSWASLDPGVRTFMTLYSPDGLAIRFGHNDNIRLLRLCKHLDKLISKRSKTKGKKRRRLLKAEQRIRYRVKNLVNDVHWKVINHLLKNFTDIVIPPFATKEMSQKTQRVITNKTSRCLYNWRHYNFRERLLQKAKSTGVNVFIRGEEFTTKTCTNCGHLNNIKGKKVICCPKCLVTVDRDVSGSRNIFLKNVSMQ